MSKCPPLLRKMKILSEVEYKLQIYKLVYHHTLCINTIHDRDVARNIKREEPRAVHKQLLSLEVDVNPEGVVKHRIEG